MSGGQDWAAEIIEEWRNAQPQPTSRIPSAAGPVPYFCTKHGGSVECERLNKERGLHCPKCEIDAR
jgi:hypothetical protein